MGTATQILGVKSVYKLKTSFACVLAFDLNFSSILLSWRREGSGYLGIKGESEGDLVD